jgi:hypothetical protein
MVNHQHPLPSYVFDEDPQVIRSSGKSFVIKVRMDCMLSLWICIFLTELCSGLWDDMC